MSGESLGVAFRLRNDYLGVWGDGAQLGKAVSDLVERKGRLPVILAVEADLRLGALIALPPDNTEGTTELYRSLETVLLLGPSYAEAGQGSSRQVQAHRLHRCQPGQRRPW